MAHAVSRLRDQRLARSAKPFMARGGPKGERCAGCRLPPSHCLCAQRPVVPTRAGVCLIMGDIEALKPSNTGWLIADVVPDTHAFEWTRTGVDPALLALLRDPQWQPHLVFPAEYAEPPRVVTTLEAALAGHLGSGLGGTDAAVHSPPRPLLVLLDGTWAEARKMFNKSPYLNALPVLSLHPAQHSNYRLRRSKRSDHLCTAEVAALCLAMAGDTHAAQVLTAHLDVFTTHYLQAKQQQSANWDSDEHRLLHGLMHKI